MPQVYRKPKRANEHQLYYLASQDMGVAHSLSRCFFWSENILWKEDLNGKRATVSLSGRDLILDTASVGKYLAEPLYREDDSWKEQAWKGYKLDLLWFEGLDHAQVFDRKADRAKLVHAIRTYCDAGSSSSTS